MLPQTLPDLLNHLQTHPYVVGLISFGSSSDSVTLTTGDYDLFVVLSQIVPAVRSLHFCIGDLPIDLNLITLDDLEQLTPADYFRWLTLCEGQVMYDPSGVVAPACARLHQQVIQDIVPLSEHAIATTRHWHQHMLDKARGRMDGLPIFCHYVLSANMTQLVKNYFRIRALPFYGETRAFLFLRTHEPIAFAILTEYLQSVDLAQKIDLLTQLCEQILAPIGGLWCHNEVLAFDTDTSSNLQAQGRQLFEILFQ